MSEKVTDKIFNYIDVLAEKLGVAAEFLLTAIIKQQIIGGIVWGSVYVVVTTLVIVIAIKSFKKFMSFLKENGDTFDDDDVQGMTWMSLTIVFALLSVIMFLVTIIDLPHQVMRIFNPEYYALKDIMSMINPD